jgi:hypothetical protein
MRFLTCTRRQALIIIDTTTPTTTITFHKVPNCCSISVSKQEYPTSTTNRSWFCFLSSFVAPQRRILHQSRQLDPRVERLILIGARTGTQSFFVVSLMIGDNLVES